MKSSRRIYLWLALFFGSVILLMSVSGFVGWTLISSNQGWAGASPGAGTAGRLSDPRLRSMEQYCTGVVQTSSDVWLVAREELRSPLSKENTYVPDDAMDLSASLQVGSPDDLRYSPYSRPYLTTLARLMDDGEFKVVATVPEVACLYATPDTETLYLFTGLLQPEVEASDAANDPDAYYRRSRGQQEAVLRSTDRGRHWTWLQDGFMTDAVRSGSVKPLFASDTSVWTWGDPVDQEARQGFGTSAPNPADTHEASSGVPTALFHSADAGRTAYRIYGDETLHVTPDALREAAGLKSGSSLNPARSDDWRFVVQVSDDKAYAWVSDMAWYQDAAGKDRRISITSRATLLRDATSGRWRMHDVTRDKRYLVSSVAIARDGRAHAVLSNGSDRLLTRLDPATGEWVDPQALPNLLPRWLADNDMYPRYFRSNGEVQVISMWGETYVPRMLFPVRDRPASVTTNAHYYTVDGGRNWQQLAIPGYLGVMGLGDDHTLYWSKGEWYRNQEPYVWHYRLKP